VLTRAEAWHDADPSRRFTPALRALARARDGADDAALDAAARSLLGALARHPLTHSPAVAATATRLRRVLSPAARPALPSNSGSSLLVLHYWCSVADRYGLSRRRRPATRGYRRCHVHGPVIMIRRAHARNGAAYPAEATCVLADRRARPLVLAVARSSASR
jgi:hypothetical protein